MTEQEAVYEYKNTELTYDELLLSNYDVACHEKSTKFVLRPYEARIYKK